jgi:hypothetical protein
MPTDRSDPKSSSTAPKPLSPETYDPDEIENRAIIETLKRIKAEREAKAKSGK